MPFTALSSGVPSLDALRGAVDAMDEHVTLLDPEGRVLHVNRARRAFLAVNGWSTDPWVGIAPGRAEGGETPAAAGLRGLLAGEAAEFRTEYACHAASGPRWFALRAMPIAVDGVGAVVVHTDVTERRLAAVAVEHRDGHDGLTGLPNRRALEERLQELLTGGPVGVVVVQLHGPDQGRPFRPGGEHAEVLRETSELLQLLVSEAAIVGRAGVDRFAVLRPGADAEVLRRVALSVDAGWQARVGRPHGLGATVGTSLAQPGDDAAAALAAAIVPPAGAPGIVLPGGPPNARPGAWAGPFSGKAAVSLDALDGRAAPQR